MLRAIVVGITLMVLASGSAYAQSRGNASLGWSGAWTPPSASDQALLNQQALTNFQLGHGILNPGGSSVTENNYNGTVNQEYSGPSSDSGAQVTNIGNLNSSTVNTKAINSQVTTGLTTSQTANGATQSGTATGNSSTGNGGFNAANNIVTTAH